MLRCFEFLTVGMETTFWKKLLYPGKLLENWNPDSSVFHSNFPSGCFSRLTFFCYYLLIRVFCWGKLLVKKPQRAIFPTKRLLNLPINCRKLDNLPVFFGTKWSPHSKPTYFATSSWYASTQNWVSCRNITLNVVLSEDCFLNKRNHIVSVY